MKIVFHNSEEFLIYQSDEIVIFKKNYSKYGRY